MGQNLTQSILAVSKRRIHAKWSKVLDESGETLRDDLDLAVALRSLKTELESSQIETKDGDQNEIKENR